jgi:preprotein translocase subunit SecE
VPLTPKPTDDPERESVTNAPPSPLEHAAPDAELAELAELGPEGLEDDSGPGGDGDGPQPPSRRRGGGGGGDDSGGDLSPAGGQAPAQRRHRNGLIAFVQGSWRELQRVQWPDQRQVMQATGVVIGFVIIAGAYLALADLVANKIVHFILS